LVSWLGTLAFKRTLRVTSVTHSKGKIVAVFVCLKPTRDMSCGKGMVAADESMLWVARVLRHATQRIEIPVSRHYFIGSADKVRGGMFRHAVDSAIRS
jgi:hypothetical protein